MIKLIHKIKYLKGGQKITEASKQSIKNWNEKNKERLNYLQKRSKAKNFIKISNIDDLLEIEKMIILRKKEL